MKLIDNASGNISQGIVLTPDNKADSYRISWNCTAIGSGKSYIRIYATIGAEGYKTYFFPIQFLGPTEFEFSFDTSSTYLEFDVIGDATIQAITLETTIDNSAAEYVKENAPYWDRIKEITSNTGKVRTEMLEGLINMTVNAFANESGTITQENGVMTWLNGTTVANSTQAVQITGGAIRIANSKTPNGEWNWTTAINGAGINAATIIAETFAALNITGVTITGGTITGGTVNGVNMIGGSIKIGDDINGGTYTEIDKGGVIRGYCQGRRTFVLEHVAEGRLHIGENIGDGKSQGITIQLGADILGMRGPMISVSRSDYLILDAPNILLNGNVKYRNELTKV